jgi:phosphoribosylamine--glycine ligase
MDRFRDFGFNIFGPTEQSAALEIDRAKGMKAMKAVGIEVPHYEQFANLKDAETFARKSDRAWVFKTLGDEDDKALSFVASDPADLVGFLQRQQAGGKALKGPVMLQEKIDMIAELGVSGWFGPEGFLPGKWNTCFEFKKMMSGDHGPNTGEMGSVLQYVETDKMAEEMLKPMAPVLSALGHRGDFAIGCGIDSKGKAHPFEFTARLGWPAFFIMCASHKGDVAKWMLDLMNGEDTLKVSRDVALGVVCAQPRFPYSGTPAAMLEGNPIRGLEDVWDQVHPAQMMISKGPVMDGDKVVDQATYMTSGEYVLVLTGLGATVEKARKSAYDAVNATGFANRIVRCDIGSKLEAQLPKLHKAGYALEMTF